MFVPLLLLTSASALGGSTDYFEKSLASDSSDLVPYGVALTKFNRRFDDATLMMKDQTKITATDDSADTVISWFSLIMYETPLQMEDASLQLITDTLKDVLDYEFAGLFMNFKQFNLTLQGTERLSRPVVFGTDDRRRRRRRGLQPHEHEHAASRDFRANDHHRRALRANVESGLAVTLGGSSLFFNQPVESRNKCDRALIESINSPPVNQKFRDALRATGDVALSDIVDVVAVTYRSRAPSAAPTATSSAVPSVISSSSVVVPSDVPSIITTSPASSPSHVPSHVVPSLVTVVSASPSLSPSYNGTTLRGAVKVLAVGDKAEGDKNEESDTVIYTSIILGAAFVLIVGLFLRRRVQEDGGKDDDGSERESDGDELFNDYDGRGGGGDAYGSKGRKMVDLPRANKDWVKYHTFREEDGGVSALNRELGMIGSSQGDTQDQEDYNSTALGLSPTSTSTFSDTSPNSKTYQTPTSNKAYERSDNTLVTAATVTKFLRSKVTPQTHSTDDNVEMIYGSNSETSHSSPVVTSKISSEDFQNGQWDEDLNYDWDRHQSQDDQRRRRRPNTESSTLTDSVNTVDRRDRFVGAFPSFSQQKKNSRAGPKTPHVLFGKSSIENSHSSSDMHPLDWSNSKSGDYDRTTASSVDDSTLEDGKYPTSRGSRDKLSWKQQFKLFPQQQQQRQPQPQTPVVYSPGDTGSISSAETDTTSKDSQRLINDLVWLEERIAQVRGGVSPSLAAAERIEVQRGHSINPIMESIVCRDCLAPPGKLNISIRPTVDGPAVYMVNDNSSLKGQLYPGDLIVAVDDMDTRKMTANEVLQVIESNHDFERKITVLHLESNANET